MSRTRRGPAQDTRRPAQPTSSRDWLTDGLIVLLVAEVVIVAFFPALRAGFVAWDDDTYLLANPNYRGLGLAQVRWMFTSMAGHYSPLTWVAKDAQPGRP